jgi:hypothetical protein
MDKEFDKMTRKRKNGIAWRRRMVRLKASAI